MRSQTRCETPSYTNRFPYGESQSLAPPFWGSLLGAKNLGAQSPASVEIRSETLSVTLDAKFPRVFKYQTASGKSLPAALESSRPTIKLNGQVYTASDLDVRVQSTVSAVTFGMRVPSLDLELDWRFATEGNELVFELTKVSEKGTFHLQTLEFPYHYLVRVPAAEGKGEAYRGEYQRQKWNEPYSNLLWQSTAHFMKISEADGEQYPKDANWASAWVSKDAPGIAATISDNIPYWKLKTQVLGGEGPGTDFAMWLGTYYYRIAGDVQPLLQSRVAVLTEDRNHDGAVDWMEAALWHREQMRTPGDTYEPKTFIYIVFIDWVKPVKEPPGGYLPPITSFAETLEIVRAVAKVTGNAKQRVTLVGWQFTGHDTGYPALNQVNERAGGAVALRKLVKDAAEYNANIEYHINLNDAYPDSPFLTKVFCNSIEKANPTSGPTSLTVAAGLSARRRPRPPRRARARRAPRREASAAWSTASWSSVTGGVGQRDRRHRLVPRIVKRTTMTTTGTTPKIHDRRAASAKRHGHLVRFAREN